MCDALGTPLDILATIAGLLTAIGFCLIIFGGGVWMVRKAFSFKKDKS
jgi:hypothetical protein